MPNKRNSTTLYLQSPGATTPIPWIDDTPDFSAFTEPTLSVLLKAWNDFIASGEELEIIPDPDPIPEPVQPDWDGFNVYMLSDATFKSYRDTIRTIDGDLNSALFNAYAIVASNGVNAFANVWVVWVQLSGINAEDRAAMAMVAESFHLPADFVAVIAG